MCSTPRHIPSSGPSRTGFVDAVLVLWRFVPRMRNEGAGASWPFDGPDCSRPQIPGGCCRIRLGGMRLPNRRLPPGWGHVGSGHRRRPLTFLGGCAVQGGRWQGEVNIGSLRWPPWIVDRPALGVASGPGKRHGELSPDCGYLQSCCWPETPQFCARRTAWCWGATGWLRQTINAQHGDQNCGQHTRSGYAPTLQDKIQHFSRAFLVPVHASAAFSSPHISFRETKPGAKSVCGQEPKPRILVDLAVTTARGANE